MAMAACSTRQRQSDVNPDGANYFVEKILFQIYDHFDQQYLTDVTFKLSNPTALVTAHRLILSAASPYFREFFKSDAGICPLVEISDIDSDTFERLITFCYIGKTLVTIDNVDRMLKAALILKLDDAVTNCVKFVIDHMTDYTLQRAYTLESETQCNLLSAKILEYEIGNFMSVMQSAEFLNFDFNKLQKILESDDLHVPTEKDVFYAVKRWYDHDASARKQQLPDLIACLRLTQFDTNFLLKIQSLPGCHTLVLETLTWLGYPLARSTLSIKYTNPRAGLNPTSEKSLFALEMNDGTIYQYNKNEDSWQKWIDIKIYFNCSQVVLMDDNLIFIGGYLKSNKTNEVRSWNIKTKTFQQLPPMNQPRHSHCLVMLDDKIYAIGGRGTNHECLRSVEMYSVSNGWRSIKSMITPRCSLNAVSLNGKIYAIGGCYENYLKSVECYDPITNCWTQCADMNEKHCFAGATVHNGGIFVVGGFADDRLKLKTVERYDPQRNAWTKICSLSIELLRTSCISIDNELWAVGGCERDVSVYDDQNDRWITKKPMPTADVQKRYYEAFQLVY